MHKYSSISIHLYGNLKMSNYTISVKRTTSKNHFYHNDRKLKTSFLNQSICKKQTNWLEWCFKEKQAIPILLFYYISVGLYFDLFDKSIDYLYDYNIAAFIKSFIHKIFKTWNIEFPIKNDVLLIL